MPDLQGTEMTENPIADPMPGGETSKQRKLSLGSSDSSDRPVKIGHNMSSKHHTQVVMLDKQIPEHGSGYNHERKRSTVVGLPPGNRSMKGLRWELCVWMDGPTYQIVMTVALFVALFFGDIMEIAASDDNVDVAVSAVLLITFIMFSFDFVAQVFARDKYVGSFFFWMDLIGTLSLVTEISWMAQPLGLDNMEEGTMMRASRTSRVGARAARMTRLLRLVKLVRVQQFLKYIISPGQAETREKARQQDTTSLISVRLSESISKQVAALTLITCVVSPLMAVDALGGARIYENLLENYVDKTWEEINPIALSLEEEFNGTAQKPVLVVVGEHEWRFRSNPGREKDELSLDGNGVKLVFDIEAQLDEMAAFSIGLQGFVIFMLLFFSTTLNAVCNSLVITPLERMLNTLQDTASKLFSALEVEVNDDGELEELGTMETILEKMTRLVQHVTSAGDQGDYKLQQILEDNNLDAGSKNYMLDMTGKMAPAKPHPQGPEKSPKAASQAEMNDEGLFPAEVDEELLDSWRLDSLAFSSEQCYAYIYRMFQKLNLIQNHLVDPKHLRKLLEAIDSLMPANPYHNFAHVIDVTHTVYRMVQQTLHTTKLSELERLSLMLGALAHDLGHPGQNNQFLIATKDALAVTYNDQAVLENSHAAMLYQTMEAKPECNILANLDDASWLECRKMIVGMILHTDMSKHFEMVSKLEVLLELKGDAMQVDDENAQSQLWDAENRQTLLNLLMHASDISNPCKPWEISYKWTQSVMGEFFSQGDLERSKGMTVSNMMDRATTSMPFTQVNFIEFVVAPLWACVCRLLPPTAELFEHLLENRQTWGDRCIEEIDNNEEKTQEARQEEHQKMLARTAAFFKKNYPIVFHGMGIEEDDAE